VAALVEGVFERHRSSVIATVWMFLLRAPVDSLMAPARDAAPWFLTVGGTGRGLAPVQPVDNGEEP
jgi:hypothetical protein